MVAVGIGEIGRIEGLAGEWGGIQGGEWGGIGINRGSGSWYDDSVGRQWKRRVFVEWIVGRQENMTGIWVFKVVGVTMSL